MSDHRRPAKAPPKPGPNDPLPPLSKARTFEAREKQRQVRDALRSRDDRDAALADAAAAGHAETLVASPAWTEFLEPLLTRDVQDFQEIAAWYAPLMSLDGKTPTLSETRAAALRSREIRDTVLTMSERGSQYYLEIAQAASDDLQRMIDSGTVSEEDLEERH